MRRHSWNRFPPPSDEERQSKHETTTNKLQSVFIPCYESPVVVPPSLFCWGCGLPLGREEAVFPFGAASEPNGSAFAVCAPCAEGAEE
jgi:hypothetical protein